MNEKLKELYKTVILEHDKSPHQFVKRENATHIVNAFNPICGDKFTLYFEVENGWVSEVSFHGFGCKISKASTSVLVKKITGKTVEEAKGAIAQYLSQFAENGTEANDGEMAAFLAARDFPGRLECATLAWGELKIYLINKHSSPR